LPVLAEGQEIEQEVLLPAAILHDIARSFEDEDQTGETDHAVLGAEIAGRILQELGYELGLVARITDCIKSHRFRSGFAPVSAEAKILFDADKLMASAQRDSPQPFLWPDGTGK
jgi:uncharacterized protein